MFFFTFLFLFFFLVVMAIVHHHYTCQSLIQFKERSSSSVREKYVNDPAYTEDVRHLALPLRRNSGPELNFSGRSSSKKSNSTKGTKGNIMDALKSNTFDARPSRKGSTKEKRNTNSTLDNISTCSSDNNLDEEVIFFTKRGQSLDRRGFSLDFIEQKRLSWFQKEFLRASGGAGGNDISIDLGQLMYDRHSVDYVDGLEDEMREKLHGRKEGARTKPTQIQRQNATRVNSSTPPEDLYTKKNSKNKSDGKQSKQKESSSRFQIGKRFLKGEIGIKSFNYYLIKEGLKSSKKKQKGNTTPLKAISKSEENIYEEIFFADKSLLEDELQDSRALEPLQTLVTQNNQTFVPISVQKDALSSYQQHPQQNPNENTINFIDCALCVEQCTDKNCEICIKQQQQQDYSSGSGYGTITKDYVQTYALIRGGNGTNNIDPENPYQTANVLQFQSYNPNNPNVYKIETTPVAFNSDYNPISQYAEIGPPTVNVQPQQQLQQTIFYAQPTTITTTFNPVYGYDTTGTHLAKSSSSSDSIQQQQQQQQRLIRPEHIYSQPDFSRR